MNPANPTNPTPNNTIQILPVPVIFEGGIFTTTGTVADNLMRSWRGTVDYGDGTGEQTLPFKNNQFTLQHLYKDNGQFKITLHITSESGEILTAATTATVNNSQSTIDPISTQKEPAEINVPVTVKASFKDAGIFDNHMANWDWGDGQKAAGRVVESAGDGFVTDSHTYTNPGVYTLSLTVIDKDGAPTVLPYEFLSVYDSKKTPVFAAGSSFMSLAASYQKNLQLKAPAIFGISVASVNNEAPHGTFKFKLIGSDLHFNAVTFESLAIIGAKAVMKGKGTINDAGNYSFMVIGIDGEKSGGQDLIRIQIKDEANMLVYDTQPNVTEAMDPTTPVNGQVIAH